MKYMVQYPVSSTIDNGAWIDPANIILFAQSLERAGFSAIAFTDHPAPSKQFVSNGGHETLDLFSALSYCAAVTKNLSLMTYLAVVPYRNPLLLLKSIATLDVLSGGRSIFVLGTGYIKSEFAALGVAFEERNALFDEATDIIRSAWTHESIAYSGSHFESMDQVSLPKPVQLPHPPLWLGGNAQIVLRRVAQWGNGWAPLRDLMAGGDASFGKIVRTPTIHGEGDLVERLGRLKRELQTAGRSINEVDVLVESEHARFESFDPLACVDEIQRLGDLGVTWVQVQPPASSFQGALTAIEEFGRLVIQSNRLPES
jgi:probable F420-dependent oxidoreductase